MADAITSEIIRSGLESLAEQMTETMARTSYSLILKEGKDCSSAILDARGRLVAEGANVPIHLNALAPCLREILRDHFPLETLAPGDMVLTNDPYLGGSLGSHHTADYILYAPVFDEDRIVAFAAIMAHHDSAGGADPQGWHRTIWEEGLRLPPLKLVSAGELDEKLVAVILRNTRRPYEQRGDLLGQLAGIRTGVRGLERLVERHGSRTLAAAIERQLEHSERRARACVAACPDGRYEYEELLLEDGSCGGPYRLHVAVTVAGDELVFDFAGTDPQVDGPINCPLSATIAATLFATLAVLDPDIPHNEGAVTPVRVRAPEGSIVNPAPPAAVYQRMAVTHQIVDAVLGALAPALPDRVVASSCGLVYCRAYAANPRTHPHGGDMSGRNEWRSGAGPSVGGLGARASSDGLSGMPCWATNVASPSIEASEAAAPVLYLRKQLRADSGGPGRQRGGLGVVLGWRVRGTDASFSHSSQRSAIPPRGLFGGRPGAGSRWVLNEGTHREHVLPHQIGDTLPLEPDDTVTLYAPGGGGVGDPLTRDPERVRLDVLTGVVSHAAAARDYGVVIDQAGAVDVEATGTRRRDGAGAAP